MMNKCISILPTLSTKIEKETDGQIAFRFGEYSEIEDDSQE